MNFYGLVAFSLVFACTVMIFSAEGVSNSSSVMNGTVEATESSAQSATFSIAAKSTPVVLHMDSTTGSNMNTMAYKAGDTIDPRVRVAEANVSINLSCPGAKEGDEVTWFKSGKDLKNDTSYKFYESGILEVVKPGAESCGAFQCSVDGKTEDVILWIMPYIHAYKDAKNVIEDDPFVMDCKAWGCPDVVLTWYFNGSKIDSSEHYVFKQGHYYNNSVLRIPHTSLADAGLYECIAINAGGNNSMTVNVAIKDKFAAVWPFLGICAEVAILCTVIFIYEKRRERRLQREQEVTNIEETRELTDKSTSAETDTKPAADLRQRSK